MEVTAHLLSIDTAARVIPSKDEIVVGTFNLRRDFYLDRSNRWENRRESVVELIRDSNYDILGVQEALPRMRAELIDELHEYDFIGLGRSDRLFVEYSDILAKNASAQCEEFHTFWLSKLPEKSGSRSNFSLFPRICTTATIKLKNTGRRIRMYNTHLDCFSQTARIFGISSIVSRIAKDSEAEYLPYIITGDFNAKPASAVIKYLCSTKRIKIKNVLEQCGGTYHGFSGHGAMCLDYIFVSDDIHVDDAFIDKSCYGGRWPSDHFPVTAALSID